MADNNAGQQAQVKHNRDVAPGRETAIATESADTQAREDMNANSGKSTQAAEGTADHGREPEYYAEKQGAD